MSLTRAEAEAEILEVVAPGMGIVGLSATAGEDGFVAALNTALRAGFKAIGITPAARTVSDEDFALIPAEDEDTFIDAAKVAVLDTILLRWDAPNERENTTSQEWGNLMKQLAERAAILRGSLPGGVPTLGVGVLSLGIIEPPECEGNW